MANQNRRPRPAQNEDGTDDERLVRRAAEAQRRGSVQARILNDLSASADSLAAVDLARANTLVDSLL